MRVKSQRLIKYVVVALVVLLLAFFLYKASKREAFDSKPSLDISGAADFQSTLGSSPKTVAYFYMPGCGHCQKMSPIFDQVSSDPKNSKIKFVKVDATKNPDIADKYGLSGFPTVLRFNGTNTTEADKRVGASDKSSLQSFCKF
jgi:thiol-disulfide isomerase/thioredoxin